MLGGLFDDAPAWAVPIKILNAALAEDAKTFHDLDPEVFWDCVKWAQGKVGKGEIAPYHLVQAALGWCRKRLVDVSDTTNAEDAVWLNRLRSLYAVPWANQVQLAERFNLDWDGEEWRTMYGEPLDRAAHSEAYSAA